MPANPVSDDVATDIYGFDISNPSDPQYIGSGTVPGTLIGQYAMSEYDGYLRVATTSWRTDARPRRRRYGAGPVVGQRRERAPARKQCAWLPLGSSLGLGSGEKIYSVRFRGGPWLRGHVQPGRPALRDRLEQPGHSPPSPDRCPCRVTRRSFSRSAPGSSSASARRWTRPWPHKVSRSRSSTCPTRRAHLWFHNSSLATGPARQPSTTRTRCCGGRSPTFSCCR